MRWKRSGCKRRKRRRWPLLLLIILFVEVGAIAHLLKIQDFTIEFQDLFRFLQTTDPAESWNLILVNQHHTIPKDYSLELTTLANGEQVDSRIYPDLQAMFDDARAEGLGLFVAAGYRTQEKQQQLLDEKIAAYRDEGHSKSEAERLARQWVTVPGTSEHQLGIAVDINADTAVCSSDDVYSWLAENAYKYGFIQRYPPDKTEITGIMHEPWHYRYVGKDAAKELYERGICLEEYLDTVDLPQYKTVN